MMQGKMLASNITYRVLNVVVVFIINMLLSRMAGVAGYGLLSLLIANAGIFNLVTSLGADAGLTYHTALGTFRAGKLFGFFFAVLFVQLAAIALLEWISFSTLGHYLLFRTADLHYWWVGPLFLFAVSVTEKYSALLNGRKFFSRLNKWILISNLIILAVFAVVYFTRGNKGADFYIITYVLLNTLQAMILAIVYHASDPEKLSIEFPKKNDQTIFFAYSLFTWVINAIQFLAYRVDYWLLNYYRGEAELGWYSLAVRLAQLSWILPLLFASIIFPMVADKTKPYDKTKLLALIRGMNMLNILAGIILFVIAPWLIPFLFGSEYQNSILLLQVLLPGVILFCVVTVLAAYFSGSGRLKYNFIGSVLCLLVIFLLDIVLIPSYGMKGAAIASSIGYGITSLYFTVIYCYFEKVPVYRLFLPEQSDYHHIRSILKSVFSKG